MPLTFKKQLFIQISVAVVLIAVCITGTAIIRSNLASRVLAIRTAKETAASEEQAIRSLILLKEQEKRAASHSAYLNGLLPDKDSLFSFKNKVAAIGKEEKMSLGFKFGAENLATDVEPASVGFQISANGAAAGFRKLIERLEASGYFIRITTFEVSFIDKPGGETFAGSIGGKVFYREVAPTP